MIGITGQIGAGKSFVGQILRARGFKVLDADAAVHELYRSNADLRKAVAAEFGAEALCADGVNRKFFADLIFKDESARKRLENLVYPALTEYIVLQNPDYVEAALFENVPEVMKLMDEFWVVTAPEQVRLTRLVQQRHLSAEDAQRRIALQRAKDDPAAWRSLLANKPLRFIVNDGETPLNI